MHAALQPEERAAQLGERARGVSPCLEAPPHLISDRGALAAEGLRIPLAIEGLIVVAEDASPVSECGVGCDLEIVDAVEHDGTQSAQPSAKLVGRHVLDVERRLQHLDDAPLELRKVLAGVHAMHRDRQMSPHPFTELDLGRRIKPPRANEAERQGRQEN